MKKIKTTKGKYVLVDNEDFDELNQYKWHLDLRSVCRYIRGSNNKRIKIHRQIMDCPKGMEVDHKDGNILNNQKKNLRICTHEENGKNRKLSKDNKSGYKGVSWYKKMNKWVAKIKVNYKSIHLGYFDSKEEAYKAYCKACIKYHGKFANLG